MSKKTSKYTGVCWNVRRQLWVATITINFKKCELGAFKDEDEAAKAYDRMAFVHGRKTNILKFKPVSHD